jgi:hypothetical protein
MRTSTPFVVGAATATAPSVRSTATSGSSAATVRAASPATSGAKVSPSISLVPPGSAGGA